jgi:hypothetical protein
MHGSNNGNRVVKQHTPASGHGEHIGKYTGVGPDVRLIQRALHLLGGDGGGVEEETQWRQQTQRQQTKWMQHGLPASSKI